MSGTISIGCQDFETIRKGNCFYIDKTAFLSEWWESGYGNMGLRFAEKKF